MILTAMNWVLIKKLFELSGITPHAAYAYVKKGIWHEGTHWVKRQGRLYFNVKAIEAWVEGKAA